MKLCENDHVSITYNDEGKWKYKCPLCDAIKNAENYKEWKEEAEKTVKKLKSSMYEIYDIKDKSIGILKDFEGMVKSKEWKKALKAIDDEEEAE